MKVNIVQILTRNIESHKIFKYNPSALVAIKSSNNPLSQHEKKFHFYYSDFYLLVYSSDFYATKQFWYTLQNHTLRSK